MKSALSLILIGCLVVSAVPVTAQQRTEAPASIHRGAPASPAVHGRFAHAIEREAVRLATAGDGTLSVVDTVQGDKSAESTRSRVRTFAPGTKVTVTVQGSQPVTRYVVRADESGLTVLNVADLTLPRAETRVLLDMVSHHPEYFAAAQERRSYREQNVRVGPDGVFVADRKVADLSQIVERIARTDLETGVSTLVAYEPITQPKKISTGAAIGIGIAMTVGGFFLLVAIVGLSH